VNPHRPTRLPFFVHRCVRRVEVVLDAAGVRNEPVVVGVSGGGDSMALLEILGLLAPKLGLSLHVVCVDHGLRAEAASESKMVRDAAERWAAAFEAVTFEAIAVQPAGSDENALRQSRHAALEEARLRWGSRFVLLGHTSDDQVETVVLRFVRGAGFGGLSGMREVRGTLLRPLLGVRRAELRRLLQARGVAWAEDPSNETQRYARGRLRSGVLPAIEAAFGRGALEHLLDVAPRWRADEDFLEREAGRLLAYASRRRTGAVDLDADALVSAHGALRARVLRRWILEATGRMPGSRQVREVERWLEGDGKRGHRDNQGYVDNQGHLDLPGARVRCAGGRLSLEVRMESATSTSLAHRTVDSPGDDTADSGGDRKLDIDITTASDDSSKARPVGDAVLPPSDGRVRFPRN